MNGIAVNLPSTQLKDITAAGHLVCPRCHNDLAAGGDDLRCSACGAAYRVRGTVPVFTDREEYWCNAGKDTMHRLIEEADTTGDWRAAMNRHIPDCARHIEPLYRGDAQFLLPVDGSSRVLDAGCMWGGVTVPLAEYCGEVHAVDKTWETVRFLKLRAGQMGLDNIRACVSPIHKLPYADGYFDAVVLNGVLEWLGTEQEIVLERDWSGKRSERYHYAKSPQEQQLEALKELRRVLRSGGVIYVAIENRFGLQYFFGYPDDHVNIPFVSILPRALANALTKRIRNTDYRTYTYSPRRLAELLTAAGFGDAKLYSVFPHYNTLARAVPFSLFGKIGSLAREGDVPFSTRGRAMVFGFSQVWKRVPAMIARRVSPSLVVLASTERHEVQPARLLQMLTAAGVTTQEKTAGLDAAIVNNRYSDGNPVSYAVFDSATARPLFYCKLARRHADTALAEESARVAEAAGKLKDTPIEGTIPDILASGVIDGVPLQVTRFIEGRRAGSRLMEALRRVDRLVQGQGGMGFRLARGVKSVARRRWLASIDAPVCSAIDWLAQFQEATREDERSLGSLAEWIELQRSEVHAGDGDAASIDTLAGKVRHDVSELNHRALPHCMQHGDFDVCNLYQKPDGTLMILDFEHAESDASPLFDIANLVFNPLLLEWRPDSAGLSLKCYADDTGWTPYLHKWIRRYAEKSGIPIEVMRFLPALGVLEQNAKRYPAHRNPYDYPMYGDEALKEMLDWRLQL